MSHEDCWSGDPCFVGDSDHCPPTLRERERRAREAKGAWSQLELRRDSGGWRHYLDGEPVHCGEQLELQTVRSEFDDHGELRLPQQAGVVVRYEARLCTDEEPTPLLYAGIAGYTFMSAFDSGMRFRWPK